MARSVTADEAKNENVAAMGPELGSIYDALWQELAWVSMKWQQFRELYGCNPERIDLLNAAAGLFFRVVQDAIWEETLLDLAKLTDPPESRGKPNLSLRRLPPLVSDTLRARLEALVEEAVEKTAFARDWRHRHIAHRDLDLALKRGAQPLLPASRQHVTEALSAVAAVLNAVNEHYRNSTTVFDLGFDEPQGAVSLLYVIRDGLEVKEKRRRRLKDGKADPDDLHPPRGV